MKPIIDEEELYSQPFSIKKHKLIPYLSLEVVISPEGEIAYALPSHQEYLIQKVMEKYDWSRDEVMDACPPKYYFNFMEWLMDMSGGYIPVWEQWVLNYPVTQQQAAALRKLKMAGLYRGAVPELKGVKR